MRLRERIEAKVKSLLPDADEIDETVAIVKEIALDIASMIDDAQENGGVIITIDTNIITGTIKINSP